MRRGVHPTQVSPHVASHRSNAYGDAMRHRGKTIAILLATSAVVVLVAAMASLRGNILQRWIHRSDADRIQGKWKTVLMIQDGETVTLSHPRYCSFDGEKVRHFPTDEPNETCVYQLNENHQPGWFDMILPNGDSHLGVYDLNRDMLRICVSNVAGGKRPVAIESKDDTDNFLWVLQRD